MLLLCLSMSIGQSAIAAERAKGEASSEFSAPAIPISSEHLIELYQSVPNLKIIDSRHLQDYALGHIDLAYNLPLQKIDCNTLSSLGIKPSQALVFYCNDGGDSSAEAVRMASACGYRRLFRLEGGFIEWKDKDYPFIIE